MTVAVAVAQFASTADEAANLAAIDKLANVAAARGARVVVFPEYSSFFTDPMDESLTRHAQAIDGRFTSHLRALSATLGITVAAGLLERGADEHRVRNTVVVVDHSGVIATYRKLHLYDAFGQRESDWVEPGSISAPETFEVDGMRFGLMTCYDLRFPEAGRRLADAGAHAFLVPAEWVRGPGKEYQWHTLIRARAIENTVFLAAADHPPPLGVGNSVVVDPTGVQLAAVGTATDVAVAHLDPDALDLVRRVNPALQLRRFRVIPAE